MSRRRFLGTASLAAVCTSAAVPAVAGVKTGPAVLLVHRAYRDGLADVIGPTVPRIIVLESDVVRQWRAGLGETVMGAGRVEAYVPWAESLILSGLAREHGASIRYANAGPLSHLTIELQ